MYPTSQLGPESHHKTLMTEDCVYVNYFNIKQATSYGTDIGISTCVSYIRTRSSLRKENHESRLLEGGGSEPTPETPAIDEP